MIQSPTPLTLIAATHEEEWLQPIIEGIANYDPYYLGIKYADLVTVSDDLSLLLDTLVEAAIGINAYKWKTLFNTLDLDYNPIWNYDGETVTEEVRGARDESHIRAARHNETTVGGAHVTTDERQAPFDSATVRDVSQSETVSLEHTDEYDADAYTDQDTAESYTDTTTETRHGNQGTTTTQQMINEERQVAFMDYISIVYKDILSVITYPYYG